MGIFKATPKSYASIVSPLTEIESELSIYIADQGNNIENLEEEKKEIEVQIRDSQIEIHKSESTVIKIGQLLSCDLDFDGIEDSKEIPPEVNEALPEGDPEE